MTSSSIIELYEQLAAAPDDKTRARLIAEAFERIEERYPEVRELPTQTHLSEAELRLRRDIEQLRHETQERDGQLRKELEQLRGETRAMEERLRKEIAAIKSETIKWTVVWTGGLLLAQAGLILGGMRFLLAGG